MPLILVFALQAAAAAAMPSAPAVPQIDFDLARYSQNELGLGDGGCRRDPSTITVCARRGGAYPLAAMARIFEPGRIVAERSLGGNLTGDVHLEQGHFADRGVTPNRIMVGLRLPF